MNADAHVINVNLETFQAEVLDRSAQIPVLLELFAEQAEQSKELTPMLLRLAESFQGKFILARLDIQENQQLVQQLQVRTLPTLKLIFQGKIVQSLEGPQDEAHLRQLLEQVTQSPLERIREQINLLVAEGHRDEAIELLQQVITEEPSNYGLHSELCDLLIMVGRTSEAEEILAALPEDAEGINKPRCRLKFLKQAEKLAPTSELTTALEAEPDNLQILMDLVTRQIVDDEMETALENLLLILQRDRAFGDDLARRTMIDVFELLGKGDSLATRYRRRMFALMH